MIYFSQRSRVDLKFSSGCHCARVKEQMDQEFSKFRHVTGCIWATWLIPLIIATDDNGEVVTHACGAHCVHADGKGRSRTFF